MEKLEPLYYLIGYLVVSNFGSIVMKLIDRSKAKDTSTEESIKSLTATVIELKTKMDIFTKDINNIGRKLRDGQREDI